MKSTFKFNLALMGFTLTVTLELMIRRTLIFDGMGIIGIVSNTGIFDVIRG